MKIDWHFIALLVSITIGGISISQSLWKIVRFMGAKSKSTDTRLAALYEALKIQASQFEELIRHVNQDPQTRGKFRRNAALQELKDEAIKQFEDEKTKFN